MERYADGSHGELARWQAVAKRQKVKAQTARRAQRHMAVRLEVLERALTVATEGLEAVTRFHDPRAARERSLARAALVEMRLLLDSQEEGS